MKVLLVNDCPVGIDGSGGVEDHVQALSTLLRDEGHHVITITGQLRGLPSDHAPSEHHLQGLGAPPIRKKLLRHWRCRHQAIETLKHILDREKPDVIHVHNLSDPLALRALHRWGPTIKSIHDCRPFCTKPRPGVASRLVGASDTFCDLSFSTRCWSRCYARAGSTVAERIEAWSYFPNNLLALKEVLACDRLLVPSQYILQLATAAGVPRGKLDVLHYFCELEGSPLQKRDADASTTVLYAGRHTREKGVLHVLDAIDRMPSLAFNTVIAGTGPLSGQVAEQAEQMRPRHQITLPGYLERSELLRHYASAAFVVFPSIGSEGCPLTGIESMYCGTPVIAFDVGGVREWLIPGETGLLVPRGDVQALANAMTELVQSPERRRTLGENARKHVGSTFRKDAYLKGLITSYRSAIQQRAAQSPSHAVAAAAVAPPQWDELPAVDHYASQAEGTVK